MNDEAVVRYATAKEYVEAIKLIITSPHYIGKHMMIAVRPTHLLAGFATELYLKAWLLADGVSSKDVQKHGHKLLDLHADAVARGFSTNSGIDALVSNLAEPHGQNKDYVFRYTHTDAKITPLAWDYALIVFDSLDVIVDAHVGASVSYGLKPKAIYS
ncbi:hypothetical protein [Methylobacterium indicum]|uniref:hypothetical protein n=1 Tax=Methylobacterium indicum TaxID=1775910 RepID=UPI000AB81DF3|nr:hypothetical protein [Methylobacterium indicum]